ncbi:hypothetical protein ACLB2K_039311 [Fragaria x ananassa]
MGIINNVFWDGQWVPGYNGPLRGRDVDVKLEQRVQGLKDEVKGMLMAAAVNQAAWHMLDMVDNIQRLGLLYCFKNEIDILLKHVHDHSYGRKDLENNGDIYTTALHFRLLRHFIWVHGGDILEQALTFTTTHLESAAPRLSSPLSKQVTHALYQPLWKGYSRLEARHYMSVYEEYDSHNETLLILAKLDFNLMQKVYQKELCDMTRWWKDLDFANKLPFARDRIVSYFWALATIFEPEYHFARTIACIYGALTTVRDDVYDVYGSYQELEHFTEAIERWDISAIDDQLPQCLKDRYKGLLDSYSSYEEKLAKEGKLYRLDYAKEAIKIQLRGYFQEAKWLKEKYTPTMEEYIPNGLNSSFYPMAITSFVGMGGLVTKDTMDWVLNHPNEPASHMLDMVDNIQRLGLSYRFENEIDTILKHVNDHFYGSKDLGKDGDLYTTALYFLLLRQ